MNAVSKQERGWKPIPLPLKILFVLIALWALGSVLNLPSLFENGLPLLGVFVRGTGAFLVVLLLDIIGPLVFLYALWTRKPWAAHWALSYIGLFLINSAVALFTVRDQLGAPQILFPAVIGLAFLAVIFWKRAYFVQTG